MDNDEERDDGDYTSPLTICLMCRKEVAAYAILVHSHGVCSPECAEMLSKRIERWEADEIPKDQVDWIERANSIVYH